MRGRITVVCVLLALALPSSLRAHFENVVTSSRSLALGGSATGVVDDASAAFLNPAALVQVSGYSVTATYLTPYGIQDIDRSFAAAAVRTRYGAVGVSWHYTGVAGVTSENLITLSVGRDLIRTTEDASLSVGASLDVARVSVSDRFDLSETAVTGGAGVLLRPFPIITMAYAVRHITEPEFDLLPGDGVTRLDSRQSWALSYRWHERVTVSAERSQDAAGEWRSRMGVEVGVGRLLNLRAGAGNGHAAGGVGVGWRGVDLDVGFSSHEFLGASYIVSIGYSPPAPENPYAQNP